VVPGELLEAICALLEKAPQEKTARLVTKHTLRENRNRTRILLAEDNLVNPSPGLTPRVISGEHRRLGEVYGMDLGLKGRVAIVAAASTGLGRAVATELLKEGAKVAICARRAGTLEKTAQELREQTGGEILHQIVDVRNEAEIANFVAAVESRFGKVDICVTNSGGPPSKLFADTRTDEWRSAIDLLLLSAVHFARETLPRMQKNGWGRFITITSTTVKQPADGLLLSNSIRSAVTGLAKTLAGEYAKYGITVNNVCPGYTATDRLSELSETLAARNKVSEEEVIAGWKRQIPAGRLGTPEEFAAVVAFLASERASYVNGTSIAIDGGIVRGLL
jgi:3-oxoacyl-[acyl-carrier protein] reductase